MTFKDKRSVLIFAAMGLTIGLTVEVLAERPKLLPGKSTIPTVAMEPVRIVGIPFAPNVNPRERGRKGGKARAGGP